MISAFTKHTWESWKLTYLPQIKPIFKYSKIKNPILGIKIATKKDKLYSPWYDKGGLLKGKPKQVKTGGSMVICSIPCVKVKNRYLILDYNHRLTDLKPWAIILDYIQLKPHQYKYVKDFDNKYWKKWLK